MSGWRRLFTLTTTGTAIITLTQHAPINGALPGVVKPAFFQALREGGGLPSTTDRDADTAGGQRRLRG